MTWQRSRSEREVVECKTPEGRLLAVVEIFAPDGSEALSGEAHPLVLLPAEEARRNGEERLQLRERGRYEYRLKPASGVSEDLQLLPQRGVQPSRVESEGEDRGLIEPQDHCGLFPLTVIRRGDATQRPLARGSVEVRSLKLDYREHYRGMLSYHRGEVRRAAAGLPRANAIAAGHALAAGLAYPGAAA